MKLGEHVVLGGGAAAVLAPVLGAEGSLAFWASSVLIDVDHHWDYVSRSGFRDWSPRGMFAFHDHLFAHELHRPDFLGLNLFHTVEWFLLVGTGVLWWSSPLLFAILWGMVFHLCLDLLRLARHRALFKRALSVIEYHVRRRRLVRASLDPDRPYARALAVARDRLAAASIPSPPAGERAG